MNVVDKPAKCIICEPKEMRPVYEHKGKVVMCTQVHGRACHSAYVLTGVNAIEHAAKLINQHGEITEAG